MQLEIHSYISQSNQKRRSKHNTLPRPTAVCRPFCKQNVKKNLYKDSVLVMCWDLDVIKQLFNIQSLKIKVIMLMRHIYTCVIKIYRFLIDQYIFQSPQLTIFSIEVF